MSGVKIKIQTTGMKQKIENATKIAKEAVSVQVAVDSNKFVAKDTGYLESSVFADSNFAKGQIIWGASYAVYAYYIMRNQLRTDKNPNASHLWFEVAKQQKLSNWIQLANNVYQKTI